MISCHCNQGCPYYIYNIARITKGDKNDLFQGRLMLPIGITTIDTVVQELLRHLLLTLIILKTTIAPTI